MPEQAILRGKLSHPGEKRTLVCKLLQLVVGFGICQSYWQLPRLQLRLQLQLQQRQHQKQRT